MPTCAGCKQPINGPYLRTPLGDWHPNHLLCAACGRPITDTVFSLHNNSAYHASCFRNRVLPRCTYCGEPLAGGWLKDEWGTRFCPKHRDGYPKCVFCGRLVPPRQQGTSALPEREVSCPRCRSSQVERMEQARPLFRETIEWLNGNGILFNILDLKVELRNHVQLAQFAGQAPNLHLLGATLTAELWVPGKRLTSVEGVAILRGLPATLFRGVAVHELGHAWLAVHNVPKLAGWAEEGFCETLAFGFYSHLRSPEAAFYARAIERNPDPVYGEGFRRVSKIVSARGLGDLLRSLQQGNVPAELR